MAAPRGATAVAVGPGAALRGAWGARTALGHRRRRRGARWKGGGNVTNDEFGKYTKKTKLWENSKNQDPTCDLPRFVTLLEKVEDDPRVDTHILV